MTTEKKPEAGTRSVEAAISIAAPAEAVWKAIADGEELSRWFPLEARVTPGAGGKIWFSWGPPWEGESRIEIWEPNRRLRTVEERQGPDVTQEGKAGAGEGASRKVRITVDYFLEARGGGTTVRLVQSGFGAGPEWDAEYEEVRRGWSLELRGLRHYLERHRGTRREVVWVKRSFRGSTHETWAKVMGPSGMLAEGTVEGAREGDAFRIKTAAGDELRGKVQVLDPPRAFSAAAENLDDALFRVMVMEYYSVREVWLWLSTWGLPPARTAPIRERWEAMASRLFPA